MNPLTTASLYKSSLAFANRNTNRALKRADDGNHLYCILYHTANSDGGLQDPVDGRDASVDFTVAKFVVVPAHFPLYLEKQAMKVTSFIELKNLVEDLYYRNPDALVYINNQRSDFDIEKFPLAHLFK